MIKDKITLLLADAQKVVIDGLAVLLQTEEAFTVGATAYTGCQTIELIRGGEYDVVLMDINMPEMDGIETTRLIKEEQPDCKIIILTSYREKDTVIRLLRFGVSGYLLKNSTSQELVSAIKRVAGNGYYFCDEVQADILHDYRSADTSAAKAIHAAATLTKREQEILRLLSEEYTNEKIATALHISYRTVETHRKNMMQKTEASNLAGLLRYAYGNGLLK